MKVLKSYDSFNFRRYRNPWVAIVDKTTGEPVFHQKVGKYTGGYNKGEAGDLYVFEPVEGAVYMYGQKDYRGNKTERGYAVFENGEFKEISAKELVNYLNA